MVKTFLLSCLYIVASIIFGVDFAFGQKIVHEAEQKGTTVLSLYGEMGTSLISDGLVLSINGDIRIPSGISWRLGYWGTVYNPGGSNLYGFLSSINFLTNPKGSHHGEVGIGMALMTDPVVWLMPSVIFGYRYQPRNGGVMFRSALEALLLYLPGDFFTILLPIPLATISVGYTF